MRKVTIISLCDCQCRGSNRLVVRVVTVQLEAVDSPTAHQVRIVRTLVLSPKEASV